MCRTSKANHKEGNQANQTDFCVYLIRQNIRSFSRGRKERSSAEKKTYFCPRRVEGSQIPLSMMRLVVGVPSHFLIVNITVILLQILVLLTQTADATITEVATGKHWNSKPDKKLGQRLWQGYEYVAHLQYVRSNLQLCPLPSEGNGNQPRMWNITRPLDSTPGKII